VGRRLWSVVTQRPTGTAPSRERPVVPGRAALRLDGPAATTR